MYEVPESPSPSMNTVKTREWDVCDGNVNATLGSDCGLIDVEGVIRNAQGQQVETAAAYAQFIAEAEKTLANELKDPDSSK